MSKTKKYYFYLNTEKAEQATAIALINQLGPGKKSDAIKNVILSGLSLKKIDERLPLLVASLLAKPTSLSTLAKVIGILSPEYNISQINNDKEIVAWQKRVRDPLLPDHGWSSWISITESEYSSLIAEHDHTDTAIQMRALIGAISGDIISAAEHKKAFFSEEQSISSPQNTVISKVNKLFNT